MPAVHERPEPVRKRLRSPMRGAWFAQSNGLMGYLLLLSGITRLLSVFRRRRTIPEPQTVRNLLINAGGHIGDAIMLTALLPAIRRHYPAAKISLLCGGWAQCVFDGHPLIDGLYVLDHWKLDRSNRSLVAKLSHYFQSLSALVPKLRMASIDLAIDPYPYYPNAAVPFWLSQAAFTAGFVSGGAGSLYDLAISLRYRNTEITQLQFDLLVELGIPRIESRLLSPSLPLSSKIRSTLVEKYPLLATQYVLVHPGTGSPAKQWPIEHWQALLNDLQSRGVGIVVTGRGAGERSVADALAAGRNNLQSLVDVLDWHQFTNVIAHADAVICLDSAAAHVAAAFMKPTVVLTTGITDARTWHPLNPNCKTLMAPVPCNPCFLGNGCNAMACIRQTPPHRVSTALGEID